jgi:cytochrome c oxidase cbb3-type subunit IV
MDINDLRSVTTLLMFAAFVGIVGWAWAGKRRASFDDAAQLPFMDDLPDAGVQGEKK